MENENKINPEKITKPIQLLAAMLVGVIIIDWLFLKYAKNFVEWVSDILAVASIINVLIVLFIFYRLQTKYRSELQEDKYYFKSLTDKTSVINLDSSKEILYDLVEYITEDSKESLKNMDAGKYSRLVKNVEIIELMENNKLLLNASLPQYNIIHYHLVNKGFIIDSLFAINAKNLPSNFGIAIGAGFNNIQLREILQSVREVQDAYICYAYDEEKENQYNNIMLIGAYSVPKRYKITDVLEMIDMGTSNEEVYVRINDMLQF